MKELSSVVQQQRLSLTETEHRARELEREASEAKKETRLAKEQVNCRGRSGRLRHPPQHVTTAVFTCSGVLSTPRRQGPLFRWVKPEILYKM